VGSKLAEGKGLREGWDSRELWKSVEKLKAEGGQQSKVESRKLKVKTPEEPRPENKVPRPGWGGRHRRGWGRCAQSRNLLPPSAPDSSAFSDSIPTRVLLAGSR